MEAKLRVIIDDRIEKLVLLSGIPHTVDELQSTVRTNFGISEDFSFQYFDAEFEEFFTLHTTDQIKHKDTIKVIYSGSIILNLEQIDPPSDISFGQQSDFDSVSRTESSVSNTEPSASNADALASNEESSAGTSSSQDTIILPKWRSTTKRCQQWPNHFPIPQFSYETENCLERAAEEHKKDGTLLTASKVKTDILDKLAESVYLYTAYPTSAQICDVAEALVSKYPCLKEPGSFSGHYGWQQSLKYKMANYRTKLRGFGVPEVMCNALKLKNPADQKSAKNVKKPRKAEVNYLPLYPAGEDEDSQEQERIELLTEVRKRDNNKLIKEKMAKTFAHRRNEVVNQNLNIEDIKARWPALFEESNIQDEFQRITTVHLESKFMSKLDEYTTRLLKLFHAKGGAMGLRLRTVLQKAPSSPDITITRDIVIRCLSIYLGESADHLLKEYDVADENVAQDLAVQPMKIYSTQRNPSEGTEDFGIVIDGTPVLTALGNFPRACAMLMGLIYAVNLAYPKELRYTFEAFQKLFLELDSSRLSPKVNSLKSKLLA